MGTGGSSDVEGLSPGCAQEQMVPQPSSSPTGGFGAVALCSVHSKKDKNFRDQSFITAGIVCGSCQGGRCSTGRGTWSILASWECQQEQDVVPGLWAGSRAAWHTWVCTFGLLPAQAAGDSQENAPRVGMALPGRLFPRAARCQPSCSCCLGTASLCSSSGSEAIPSAAGKQHIPVGLTGKGTAAGASLEHIVLLCPRGQILCWDITFCPLLKVPALRHPSWQGLAWPAEVNPCSWERSGTGDPLMGADIS